MGSIPITRLWKYSMLKPHEAFSQALLHWYDLNGRHNLPWKKEVSPYRVWVSEIMLQQTQVSTVIPYFERFIERFPYLKNLAEAHIDDVLSYWSGLGYYARARNLHHTAQILHHQHRGKFPEDLESLMELPGIGRSTAGAIMSLGMHIRAHILDGNVKRVLSRFHAILPPFNQTAALKKLWRLAESYTPQERFGDYNQALMDLGSLICTRTKPQCSACPLYSDCKMMIQEKPSSPLKKIKNHSRRQESIIMLLLLNDKKEILLMRRPPVGIWGGLWSFPQCELKENISAFCKQELGMQVTGQMQFTPFLHKFSHFDLQINPLLLNVKVISDTIMDLGHYFWYKITETLPGGIPAPVSRLFKQLRVLHDSNDLLSKIG